MAKNIDPENIIPDEIIKEDIANLDKELEKLAGIDENENDNKKESKKEKFDIQEDESDEYGKEVKIESKKIIREDLLNRETDVLKSVFSQLQPRTKVRIYKLNEEKGSWDYIATISAEVLKDRDIYQYLKKKFGKKYGGGEYKLEFLDPVSKEIIYTTTVSIADDEEKIDFYIEEGEDLEKQIIKQILREKELLMKKYEELQRTILEKEKEELKKEIELLRERIKEYEELLLRAREQTHNPQIDVLMREIEELKMKLELQASMANNYSTQNQYDEIENDKKDKDDITKVLLLKLIDKMSEKKEDDMSKMFMQFLLQQQQMLMQQLLSKDDKKELIETISIIEKLKGDNNNSYIMEFIKEQFKMLMENKKDDMLDQMQKLLQMKEIMNKLFGNNTSGTGNILETLLASLPLLLQMKGMGSTSVPGVVIDPKPISPYAGMPQTVAPKKVIPQTVKKAPKVLTPNKKKINKINAIKPTTTSKSKISLKPNKIAHGENIQNNIPNAGAEEIKKPNIPSINEYGMLLKEVLTNTMKALPIQDTSNSGIEMYAKTLASSFDMQPQLKEFKQAIKQNLTAADLYNIAYISVSPFIKDKNKVDYFARKFVENF